MVITWNTSKTERNTYKWRVYKVGYQVASVELKSGECATRAQAVGAAKRWSRYCKQQARNVEVTQ